jgi:hypothetical protein
VERIESDGTPIYTEDARRTAKPFCAELAEVLSPRHWESRLTVLRSFYEDCLRMRQIETPRRNRGVTAMGVSGGGVRGGGGNGGGEPAAAEHDEEIRRRWGSAPS